jgi:hypothetical protein
MTGASETWDAALAQGRILLQRTKGGGPAFFPPREFAPGTGQECEWVEASGRGTVYSLTWVQKRPPEQAYNVVLVDLDEGVRMMGRVDDVDETSLYIGMPVTAYVAGDSSPREIRFKPAGEQ